ncbi:hypothetical protein ACFQLX_05455 [Streptomyces polyrhachis]|uniref:Uncharacterized protein n=1 Tax=Streptomyces polyrhachis TaxID=1282885 RepID=A0ABW2GCV3_9ACTN
MRPESSHAPLEAAFPRALRDDVQVVLRLLPPARFSSSPSFSATVQGEDIAIPYRLYNDEPTGSADAALTPVQSAILHCLYTRHHDGVVRQRHLERVVGVAEPWIAPYVVQLVGEYVVEIVVAARKGLVDLDAPDSRQHAVYGAFVAANRTLFDTTQRRAVSYWSCYYRHRYETFQSYPGCGLLDSLWNAATHRTGQPRSRLIPVTRARSLRDA